jgi:DNA-binding response OmpR family regulator
MALEAIAGMEVSVAGDAVVAMQILGRAPHRVAAVITDWRMPSVSGLDLLRALKSDAALCDVPVLVISGDSDPELPALALSGGAAAFFTKPYSPLAVRKRLEQVLA